MEERRRGSRCPVCQGPIKFEESTNVEKCRNSLCAQNHPGVKCPRCQAADVEATGRTAAGFTYTCRDCQHRFEG